MIAWSAYLVVGASAGLLAGLFGVGGGAIIVPILIVLFRLQGFGEEGLVHLALGTSFATIIVTSMSATLAHHRRANIDWPIVVAMMPGLVLGVAVCSMLASRLAGSTLQLAIGLFLFFVGIQMFFGWRPAARFGVPSRRGLAGAGIVVGGVSAFFGIGGGSLTVPFLSACRVPMLRAVACSSACGLPIAVVGTLSYALLGAGSQIDLPPAATGYLYWPAFLGIVLASMPCAKLGARVASHLPEKHLKKSFSILLLLVAVGFFWPG